MRPTKGNPVIERIDPATVEPVPVKVVKSTPQEKTGLVYTCPNCGIYPKPRIGNGVKLPKYCPDCGQRLDWEVE